VIIKGRRENRGEVLTVRRTSYSEDLSSSGDISTSSDEEFASSGVRRYFNFFR
jgi:hypothetical protein